jgi:hypothetical protein
LQTDTKIDIISIGAVGGYDAGATFDFGEWRDSDAIFSGSEVGDKEVISDTEIDKETGVAFCSGDIAYDFDIACALVSLFKKGDCAVSNSEIYTSCDEESIKSWEGIFCVRRECKVCKVSFKVVLFFFSKGGHSYVVGCDAGEFSFVGGEFESGGEVGIRYHSFAE